MATRSKVRVNVSPVAQNYADEKIIEFDSPNGGGLIAFLMQDDGSLIVDVYRTDDTVMVRHPQTGGTRCCENCEGTEQS